MFTQGDTIKMFTEREQRGGDRMTNLELLNQKIRDSGIKLNWIEEALGLSYMGLKRKLNGETEFKVSEANKIAQVLNLSEEDFNAIFCAR